MKVDLVYLWVDGSDPAWLKRKNEFLGRNFDESENDCKGRYFNNDELKYSLRSAEKYAPWINHIYIVTDNQTPDFLNLQNHKISIIDHKDILPEKALPCYNSSVIERYVYKIQDLSERFLYANDDTFFNDYLSPNYFFNKEGFPIVHLQRIIFGKLRFRIKEFLNIRINNYRRTIDRASKMIEKRYGKYYSGIPHHNIDSYLKSDYSNVLEKVFVKEFDDTADAHIRSENDIQHIVFSYYALAIKHAVIKYVGRKDSFRLRFQKPRYFEYFYKYNPKLFCVNDSQHSSDNDRKRAKDFLENLFPTKSQFEK